MAKSARDIITSSLKKLGVVASGETPSAEELQDGLSALQNMLDTWSTNDLLGYTETDETFSLVGAQGEYTIGSGGDFNTTRPLEILGINLVEPDGLEIPMRGLKAEQWQGLSVKSTSSAMPTDYYFRTEWPLGKLYLWPVPAEVKQVKVYSRKPIATVTTANTSVDLPNGYIDAIVFNLCLELVDEFGGNLTENIVAQAEKKLTAIKTQNLEKNVPYMASDRELCGEGQGKGSSLSSIYTGGA